MNTNNDINSCYYLQDKLSLNKITFNSKCFFHFAWRGYTDIKELLPDASNYSSYFFRCSKNERKEKFKLFEELHRVYGWFDKINKLGLYPYPMPKIFQSGNLNEAFLNKIIENIKIYPQSDDDLLQVLSFIQHKFQGTSLIDFSDNFFKALYFAIGKRENWDKSDTHLMGIDLSYFTWLKEPFGFDVYRPSYFMNKRIENQEGLFIYQKFKIPEEDQTEYKNLYNYFEDEINKHNWIKVTFDDIKDWKPNPNNLLYCDITIPKEEKSKLHGFLEFVGIDYNLLFCDIEKMPWEK